MPVLLRPLANVFHCVAGCSRQPLLLLAIVSSSLLMAGSLLAAERPNVVFIFSDDQRFDTIGALGNKDLQTPHLDRLVARGSTFTNTYIMGSTQPAVCVCSRAGLMSGRGLFRAPANLQGAPLLPKVLSQAGVKTYGIGKWHNGPASFAAAFDDGAAIFFGGMHDHSRIPVFAFAANGKYPKSAQQIQDTFSTELFADKAVAFLQNYQEAEPFFLYVAMTAPHDPRTPPGKYKTMYDPARLQLPPNLLPEHPFDNGELKIRDEKLAPWPRTEAVVRQHLADYYGMISHLDEQVGRIAQALEDSPHAQNTILIFVADNGLAVGQHGLLGKQSLYEHSVRVPLVLAGPGIPQKRRVDASVYLFDLFPTLCELQGAKTPPRVEGQSLLTLLAEKPAGARSHIFAAYRDTQRMIRVGDYKLIRYPQIDKTQLFNLAADPWETQDLSGDEQQQARIATMLKQLQAAQAEFGDKLPLTAAGSSLAP